MRIEQFKQLTAIVENKSITKAAIKLNVSQPALSISMKNLEKDLGFKIFEKTGRTLTLTPLGEHLYICARRINHEMMIINNLKNDGAGGKSVLNVANSFSILAKDTVVDLTKKYAKDNVSCSIVDCSISEIVEKLSVGLCEIGIVRFPQYKVSVLKQILDMEGLEYERLAIENICVVVGKNNPLYNIENNSIALEHIRKYKFLTYSSEQEDNLWMNFLSDLSIDYSDISLASVGNVMAALRTTDFAFIDTKKDHTHEDWYKDIRYIEINPPIKCELGYIKSKNTELSKIGQEFLDTIKERISLWREKRPEPK